jgi:UPF0042 nucleotide-binding protein
MTNSRPILFVTGLSGAGISTSLKALEDFGYEVFDNFPMSHVTSLLDEQGFEDQPIAVGFDSRTRAYSPDRLIQMSREIGAKIIFLNTTNEIIQKRFSETRRTHPLAKDRTVTDGIIYEREWLSPLVDAADITLNTTDLSVHDLKHMIESEFSIGEHDQRLNVTVMSFGFKHGVPREVDMVLDARFLRNPHWDKNLKPLTGQTPEVQAYINEDDNLEPFYNKVQDMVDFLLPNYNSEGKSYFTIAFGCTGGKHRSVYLTERLGEYLKQSNYNTHIRHRDMS